MKKTIKNTFLAALVAATVIACSTPSYAQSTGKTANLVRSFEDADGRFDLDGNPQADPSREVEVVGFSTRQVCLMQFGRLVCRHVPTSDGVSLEQMKDWKFGWVKTPNSNDRATLHSFSPLVTGNVALPATPALQVKSGYFRFRFADGLANSTVRIDIGVWSENRYRVLANIRLLHNQQTGEYWVTHWADSTYASAATGFSMGQLARLDDPTNGADLLVENQPNKLDVEAVPGTNLVQTSKMIWVTLPTQYRLTPSQIVLTAFNQSGQPVAIETLGMARIDPDVYEWAKFFVPQF